MLLSCNSLSSVILPNKVDVETIGTKQYILSFHKQFRTITRLNSDYQITRTDRETL